MDTSLNDRANLPTGTLLPDGSLVPWLAASGPLSYTPEDPPSRDYYFQYGWVLKQVCTDAARRSRHLYFGAPIKDYARELFEFWTLARSRAVARVLYQPGGRCAGGVEAPIAAYRYRTRQGADRYLLIQHGSYQLLDVEEQPLLEEGLVVLHRGLGKAPAFEFPEIPRVTLGARAEGGWQRYLQLQLEILSRSDVSFNSIHDRASRAETSHILDRTWMTDDLAVARGLDLHHPDIKALWRAAHESFALARWVGEHKFGPNRVVCRTPVGNIRITSFFAGEHEVRVIDPGRVDVVDSVGCVVKRRPVPLPESGAGGGGGSGFPQADPDS